jgi:hypothetical protein
MAGEDEERARSQAIKQFRLDWNAKLEATKPVLSEEEQEKLKVSRASLFACISSKA